MSAAAVQLELGADVEADLLADAAASVAAARNGMALAERAERVQLWKDLATRWLANVPSGTLVTADDLVAACGLPDHGVARNNVVGAFFSSASKRGRVRFTGTFRKSERVIGHGNLQRVWVVT